MAVQLFGSEPDLMAEAASMIEHSSYRGCTAELPPAAIDLNMGCPMRKITGNGEGSALMRDPALAEEIVRAVCKAVSLPVTVKIRAGWDAESINAPELAKRLEQAGAALVCVHARTREQMYAPGIDLSVIERTKRAVSIPVIGNGDILSGKDALHMMNRTGCDGVMIGRGAMGNPWIFSEIVSYLSGEKYSAPTNQERIDLACEQLDAMLEAKGPRVGLSEAKKHLAWYIAGMRGAASARTRLMNAASAEEMKAILANLLAEGSDPSREGSI
jgi:nifR3 family TIM-barrel protein